MQTTNTTSGRRGVRRRAGGIYGGVRMAQINLGKGKAATSALLKAIEEGRIDAIAIQEPHVRGGKL